jgi:hypothetical protein
VGMERIGHPRLPNLRHELAKSPLYSLRFGTGRLDEVLGRCDLDAKGIVRAVIEAVDAFTGGHPPEDDRTLLVAQVG